MSWKAHVIYGVKPLHHAGNPSSFHPMSSSLIDMLLRRRSPPTATATAAAMARLQQAKSVQMQSVIDGLGAIARDGKPTQPEQPSIHTHPYQLEIKPDQGEWRLPYDALRSRPPQLAPQPTLRAATDGMLFILDGAPAVDNPYKLQVTVARIRLTQRPLEPGEVLHIGEGCVRVVDRRDVLRKDDIR